MNEYVTMKEIYNEASRVDKPMMFDTTALTQFPFLSEYFEHYQDFDRQFGKVLSNYRPIYNVDDISTTDSERQILMEQVWNEFRKDTTAELRRYNYNLKKLFSLIEKEYNPLENYNRHEESIDTGSDKTDETNNYDSVHTKSDFGKQKETQNFGENSETAVRGERNESVNYGEAVDTSVNKLLTIFRTTLRILRLRLLVATLRQLTATLTQTQERLTSILMKTTLILMSN